MSKNIVYLLCDHKEDGPEHSIATLDQSKLLDMMKSNFPSYTTLDMIEIPSLVEELKYFNLNIDQITLPCRMMLSDGWGGIQLHCIELQ